MQPRKPAGSGLRALSAETVRRIRFLRRARQLGFSLGESGELLSLLTEPAADCGAVRARATAKVEEVNHKIADLERTRGALEVLIASCPGCGELKTSTILDAPETIR